MRYYLPLAGLCLAVFLSMAGMGLAGVALPEKYLQAAGSMRSAGLLSSLFAVAYISCQYPSGLIADRFGYSYVLAFGFLFMALSATVYAQSNTAWGIYLGRMLQGAGEAPVWAAAPAYLGRVYCETRGRAIGWYNAAFHLGMLSGPCFVLLGCRISGVLIFQMFAWLCLAGMLLVLTVVRRHWQDDSAAADFSGAIERNVRVWPLFLGVPVFGAAYGLATSCMPVYLVFQAMDAQGTVGRFYFCLFLGVTLAQYAAGRLSDQYGRTPFMSGGLFAAGLGLLGFFAESQVFVLFSIFAMGLGLGTFAVASLSLVNERAGEGNQGKASGCYYLGWGAGYFLGPLLANCLGLHCICTLLVLIGAAAGLLLLRLNE